MRWRIGDEELSGFDRLAESTSVTVRFPREEIYGVTSQIRNCSASIAANIAETVSFNFLD